MLRQRLEAGVEDNFSSIIVFEHRGLLVINQHGFHAAAEVTERLHQRFVSVLRILARRGEDMKAARVAQRIDREVDFTWLARHFGFHFTPVVLQLITGLRFEANGFTTMPESAFGLDIFPQHGGAAVIALRLDFLENHLGIPDMFTQAHIDKSHIGFKFAHTPSWEFSARTFRLKQVPPDRAF